METNDEIMEVQLAKPEREFVKVYKDFLNSSQLTTEEKLVYIALKSFVTYGYDSGEVFPSMATLCELTSMSRPRATRTITSLIKKGIVHKKRRGLTKSNLYTLVDNPAMWSAGSVEELRELATSEISLSSQEMLAELERRGDIRIVDIKKESSSDTDQSTEEDALSKQFNVIRTTSNSSTYGTDCQERYSIEQIKELYDYDLMVHDNPLIESDIDAVMNILYDTLNTTKDTIRVAGENKPAMVVIGKLMKIGYEEIKYAIKMYHQQSDKINHHTSYMLTLLYRAAEQYHLDTVNQVRNMYGK